MALLSCTWSVIFYSHNIELMVYKDHRLAGELNWLGLIKTLPGSLMLCNVILTHFLLLIIQHIDFAKTSVTCGLCRPRLSTQRRQENLTTDVIFTSRD